MDSGKRLRPIDQRAATSSAETAARQHEKHCNGGGVSSDLTGSLATHILFGGNAWEAIVAITPGNSININANCEADAIYAGFFRPAKMIVRPARSARMHDRARQN